MSLRVSVCVILYSNIWRSRWIKATFREFIHGIKLRYSIQFQVKISEIL